LRTVAGSRFSNRADKHSAVPPPSVIGARIAMLAPPEARNRSGITQAPEQSHHTKVYFLYVDMTPLGPYQISDGQGRALQKT
jgi:hypothetical protein